jgi:hypothetical protein
MSKVFKAILILLIIILLVIIAGVGMYLLWQKDFESKISTMTCSINETESISLDDKFKDFVLSSDKTTFVELSPLETVSLLKNINIVDGGNIQNICVNPSNGEWDLYIKMSFQGLQMPWFRLDLAKDDMETAQLYVKDIYIGKWKVPENIVENIKTKINKGISDALTLANENNFLGRKLENIELLEDKVVVKGSSDD